jgi:hypothetical protein
MNLVSTLLNKPYDAFADEGAEEDVQVEVKSKSKTGEPLSLVEYDEIRK